MSSKSGIITSLVIIIVVFGGVSGLLLMTNPFEPSKVGVVIMDPGFDDWGFADNMRLGMDEAGYEIAIQYEYPEVYPTTIAEAKTLMESLAERREFLLILVLGEELGPACLDVAESFPDQKFGMIGVQIDAPNVMSTSFATEQGAYLAGVLAAAEASSYINSSFFGDYRTIGILAAVAGDPAIDRMVNGFIEGATDAISTQNLSVTISPVQYVGSYGDNATATTTAYSMFTDYRCAVIFAPVRASIHGVIQAANLTLDPDGEQTMFNFIGARPIVIAAEFDLDYYGCANPEIPTAPSYIGTSITVNATLAVQSIIEATFWDDFVSGHSHLTLGIGVNLTVYEYSSTYLEAYTIELVDEYYTGIMSGTIVVTPP